MTPEEKSFQEMMTKLNELPEFKQKAVKWALCHWKLVESLCRQEAPLSPEEFEKETQKAVDTQDYAYYALLVYSNMISKGKETGNQE